MNSSPAGKALSLDPARTGFDFDGVIADTVEAVLRLACEDYGYCDFSAMDLSSFYVEECLPMADSIVEAIFEQITLHPLAAGLKPMPGATRVLQELGRHHRITIITARPDPGPVERWLAHFCDRRTCAGIQVLATNDHDNKERFIRQAGLHSFIDDRTETCLALQRQGIDARVFAQPWNQGRHHLPTFHSWEEIGRQFRYGAVISPEENP